jgi:FkbM family methyltransferase
MHDGDLLIDIGANIGVYSVYAALRHPASRVVALEPEYANLHLLRDNIVMNGLSDRVDVFAVAISDRSRLSYLHVRDLTPGSALHTESHDRVSPAARTTCREGVFGQTLDDFCVETGLQPNCVKIDVDGNEPKVLAGGQRTLRAATLRSVLIELPGEAAARADCESQLARAGFIQQANGTGNSIWNRSPAA